MSEIQIILVIIAAALGVWQIILGIAWAKMITNPNYTNVTVGVGAGVVAVILAIIAVLL